MNYSRQKHPSLHHALSHATYTKRLNRAERIQRVYGLRWVFLILMMIGVTGCGGGGSSSGGGPVAPTLLVATYQGTYTTSLFNGSITVDVNQNTGRGIITLTGIRCLPNPIDVPFAIAPNGNVGVSGDIPSVTNVQLNIPGNITVSFPQEGGQGSIAVDAGGTCGSSVGSVSVTRL